MKVLVIGSGGREHALAWRLRQCPSVSGVVTAPGNPGCEAAGACIHPPDSSPEAYLAVAESVQPHLTVVGPEAPLAAGIVDLFRAHKLRIVGPTARAAQIESSKIFAKRLLQSAGIPTARAAVAGSRSEAKAALSAMGHPLVIKYDGLAAGKGVVIAQTESESAAALQSLPEGAYLIEEFLTGEEVSFIVYVHEDGAIVPFEASQDHKAIHDDDQGPNTGGMGAYSDGRILTSAQAGQVMDTVIEPAVRAMADSGVPFSGFLYAGLMMTATGPKVLEFNARLGDPETQALMHRLDSDLAATLAEATPLRWKPAPSVCVVLAAHGYPGAVRTGDRITGVDGSATVFHAATKRENGHLVTAGGRVLGVTARGATLPEAIRCVYAEAGQIHFDGMQYRTDIGRKGLKRW